MIQQPRIVRFVYKAPLVLVAFFGCGYAVHMALKFREDSTNVTNAGFAIMATLAALSFSFARVIESENLKDRVMFAGERLLHGSIFVLVASVMKYFLLLLLKIPGIVGWAEVALSSTLGVGTGLIFSTGVLFAHTGLRVLNDLLVMRFTRHKDWDDIW